MIFNLAPKVSGRVNPLRQVFDGSKIEKAKLFKGWINPRACRFDPNMIEGNRAAKLDKPFYYVESAHTRFAKLIREHNARAPRATLDARGDLICELCHLQVTDDISGDCRDD